MQLHVIKAGGDAVDGKFTLPAVGTHVAEGSCDNGTAMINYTFTGEFAHKTKLCSKYVNAAILRMFSHFCFVLIWLLLFFQICRPTWIPSR